MTKITRMTRDMEYKGIKFTTKTWVELPESEYEYLINNYYAYDQTKVDKQLVNIINGKSNVAEIYKKYFERIANDTVLYYAKYSINDVLANRDVLGVQYGRILNNTKVYDKDLVSNFKTSFRIGGIGFAGKPSNYPIKSVREMLAKYLPNGGNYYDPCCGWGVRMLGSVNGRSDINYFGTDVNDKLVKQLHQLGEDINQHTLFNFDVRCVSATDNVPVWNDNMDFIFTSPPYFLLEDYQNGEQSTKGMSEDVDNYGDWLESFMKPMLLNCDKYLKIGGHLAININDYKKFTLFGDTQELILEMGNYELVSYEVLKNISRCNASGKLNTGNNEDIMVFKKIKNR